MRQDRSEIARVGAGEEGGTVAYQRKEVIGDCTLYLGDCRDILPTLAKVDAVVTDPPYGIGEAAGKNASRGNVAAAKDYGDDAWDDQPIAPELMRLVRSAGRWNIIFGGNYYDCPPASCWLVWDKLNRANDFADCELAWTNLPKAVRRIRYLWNGMLRANGEGRGDHPTQKPIGVMTWALQQLPADARTIIDPFMGSGTTGVACVKAGLSFVGIEQREQYFEAACKRIAEAYRQPRLFSEPVAKPVQTNMLEQLA
jgi:DNA modification methylase